MHPISSAQKTKSASRLDVASEFPIQDKDSKSRRPEILFFLFFFALAEAGSAVAPPAFRACTVR
jgi:hypothetical protein